MAESVDMRADMVEHADEVRLKRHRIARHAKVLRFRGLVRQMLKIHGPLEKLVRGHVVFDQERKIERASPRRAGTPRVVLDAPHLVFVDQ